jgi:hypothetical protein
MMMDGGDYCRDVTFPSWRGFEGSRGERRRLEDSPVPGSRVELGLVQ